MLVYQKTMFDHYYCIKSFCHLKTLENTSKSSFLYYYNCAKKHEGSQVLKKPGLEQRPTSFQRHKNPFISMQFTIDDVKMCYGLENVYVEYKSRAPTARGLPD